MSATKTQFTQQGIEKIVIDAVLEQQQISDEPVLPVAPSTCPFTDLPNFDSLRAISAMLEINAVLGKELARKGEPFSALTGSKRPTIHQIAVAVFEAVNKDA